MATVPSDDPDRLRPVSPSECEAPEMTPGSMSDPAPPPRRITGNPNSRHHALLVLPTEGVGGPEPESGESAAPRMKPVPDHGEFGIGGDESHPEPHQSTPEKAPEGPGDDRMPMPRDRAGTDCVGLGDTVCRLRNE